MVIIAAQNGIWGKRKAIWTFKSVNIAMEILTCEDFVVFKFMFTVMLPGIVGYTVCWIILTLHPKSLWLSIMDILDKL